MDQKSLDLIGASAFSLIFFSAIQFALIAWRNRKPEPYYDLVRCYALYFCPVMFLFFAWLIYGTGLWTILICWVAAILLSFFGNRSIEKVPLPLSAPSAILYAFISFEYLCLFLCCAGIGIFGIAFFISLFRSPLAMYKAGGVGFAFCFHGLYLGLFSNHMSARMFKRLAELRGLSVGDNIPRRMPSCLPGECLLCGKTLENAKNRPLTLDCGHIYHELCVHSWMMTGEKAECFTCRREMSFKPTANGVGRFVLSNTLKLQRAMIACMFDYFPIVLWSIAIGYGLTNPFE